MGSESPAAAPYHHLPSEWRATEVEDERFLPTIESDASEIEPGLWLGSEPNVLDVVWLKVHSIRRILTVNSYPISPINSPHLSENLKLWFTENVQHEYVEALDTPTQLMTPLFRKGVDFITNGLNNNENVIVHCGRGISRSATMVIAALMRRNRISYMDAFALVSSKRACIYPNIGFQLQLCLFESLGFEAEHCAAFDVSAEIAISIERTLNNVEERLEAIFDDGSNALEDPSRWLDFGFFFQNCREYLGHVDIGLPLPLLTRADDVGRRLRNLEAVFQGDGVATAARVGRVIDVWQSLQVRMAAAPGAVDRIDLSTYTSKLPHDDNANNNHGGGLGPPPPPRSVVTTTTESANNKASKSEEAAEEDEPAKKRPKL